MPASPPTPRRRRPSSNKSIASIRSTHSRKTSIDRSILGNPSPSHVLVPPHTPYDDFDSFTITNRSSRGPELYDHDAAAGGLGSLADELAEALSEEEDASEVGATAANGSVAAPSQSSVPQRVDLQAADVFEDRHRGADATGSTNEEELGDMARIRARLEIQLSNIERLVKQSLDEAGKEEDAMISRFTSSLKYLTPQSGIENGTSRLMTTHAALSAHVVNEARRLQTLFHHLISPVFFPPEPEFVDEFLPLLAATLDSIPSQDSQCLSALHQMRSSTSDLQATLSYLSESIYMSRQTMTAASRTLRTLNAMVLEMRREAEGRDEAIRWIENGSWDRRLLKRECQSVCGDVVGGFEEICEGWRERLVALSV